jgi:hypothetical protein
VEAAVSRNSLILPNLAILMNSQNAMRVAGAGDKMLLEGESVWLLLSSVPVFASGEAAVFAFACFLCLLLGAMVRR